MKKGYHFLIGFSLFAYYMVANVAIADSVANSLENCLLKKEKGCHYVCYPTSPSEYGYCPNIQVSNPSQDFFCSFYVLSYDTAGDLPSSGKLFCGDDSSTTICNINQPPASATVKFANGSLSCS